MLTYSLDKKLDMSMYEQLYTSIRLDIVSGVLTAGEKLPSKRMLAQHLEISVVTVENAYEQLMAEGYIYSEEKRGYFVCEVERPPKAASKVPEPEEPVEQQWFLDFVTNSTAAEFFPFDTWARLMRRTILDRSTDLLHATPSAGALELRQAIAAWLRAFRGMAVSPSQIVLGAGTESLYSLLIQLLGRDKRYAMEDPGYGKIAKIYENEAVSFCRLPLDGNGLSAVELRCSDTDVVHISPSHHYPTGIVMPIGRRQELLRWAGERGGRYILEDEYDSEFRFVGRPIPTLFSADEHQRVIYINTFSKTIAPSIRISYMVLPPSLLASYQKRLSFYACPVSSFEQYTLAAFLSGGHFEHHLSRMKTRYHKKRDAVVEAIRRGLPYAEIMEQDAGLHFLVRLRTGLSDHELQNSAAQHGIRLALLSDYHLDPKQAPPHVLVVNYSGIQMEHLEEGLARLKEILDASGK